MADANSKLDSNDNIYILDHLEVSAANGDFDWTNDKTDNSVSVSYLYDKLVVHSNTDWASRTASDTPFVQDITGKTFNNCDYFFLFCNTSFNK